MPLVEYTGPHCVQLFKTVETDVADECIGEKIEVFITCPASIYKMVCSYTIIVINICLERQQDFCSLPIRYLRNRSGGFTDLDDVLKLLCIHHNLTCNYNLS